MPPSARRPPAPPRWPGVAGSEAVAGGTRLVISIIIRRSPTTDQAITTELHHASTRT